MFDLFILLIIWFFDLPLLENNPFILSRIKWSFLLSDEIFSGIHFDVVEENQSHDEENYSLLIGSYEYNLYRKIYTHLISIPNKTFFSYKFFYSIILILTLLYTRRASLTFFFLSFTLPIVMYYICVLADYHEAIREIFYLMKQIIENT